MMTTLDLPPLPRLFFRPSVFGWKPLPSLAMLAPSSPRTIGAGAARTALAAGRGIDGDEHGERRVKGRPVHRARCAKGDADADIVPDDEGSPDGILRGEARMRRRAAAVAADVASLPPILRAHWTHRTLRGEERDASYAYLASDDGQTALREAMTTMLGDGGFFALSAFDRLARIAAGQRERRDGRRGTEEEDVSDALSMLWQAEGTHTLPGLSRDIVPQRHREPRAPRQPIRFPFSFVKRQARRLADRANRAPRHALHDAIETPPSYAPRSPEALLSRLRELGLDSAARAVVKRLAPVKVNYKRRGTGDPARSLSGAERIALMRAGGLIRSILTAD